MKYFIFISKVCRCNISTILFLSMVDENIHKQRIQEFKVKLKSDLFSVSSLFPHTTLVLLL